MKTAIARVIDAVYACNWRCTHLANLRNRLQQKDTTG